MLRERILQLADSNRDRMIELLRDVISFPSTSGSEGAVIERLQQEMMAVGYDDVRIDPLGNLIGRIGSGDRLVAVDGHCDTVGIGNLDNWDMDPFKGDYRDGFVYGRGAADQKGGLVSALYAGIILKEIGLPADASVLVVASVLEEDFEGLCWKYIIEESGIVPRVVILTEPTDLEIKIGQRGRMEIRVETHGVSCHGSAPERGDNAIYKVVPIVLEIAKLNGQLPSKPPLGKGTVTVTDIKSKAPSLCAVPDHAQIHLDRRLTVGETLDTAVQEVLCLESVSDSKASVTVPEYEIQSYTGLAYPVRAYYSMWLMQASDPEVQTAAATHSKLFGAESTLGVWRFSTNGVVTKGVFDIPTIGFGPGSEALAHAPNERVRDGDLVKAAAFYAAYVLDYCST